MLTPGMLSELSHPALKLYLLIWGECQRKNRDIVEKREASVELTTNNRKHAGIDERSHRQTRTNSRCASDQSQEAKPSKRMTLSSRILARPATIGNRQRFTKINYTKTESDQNQSALFSWHGTSNRYLNDDADGMMFRCPFNNHDHGCETTGISSGDLAAGGGLWMCHFDKCRRHGKKRHNDSRPWTITNGWW